MCQNTRTSKSFGLSFIILLCLLKEVFYIFSLENHDLDKARSKLFMPDVHLICNQPWLQGNDQTTSDSCQIWQFPQRVGAQKQAHRYFRQACRTSTWLQQSYLKAEEKAWLVNPTSSAAACLRVDCSLIKNKDLRKITTNYCLRQP